MDTRVLASPKGPQMITVKLTLDGKAKGRRTITYVPDRFKVAVSVVLVREKKRMQSPIY